MSQLWNYLSATPPTGLDSSVIKALYQFDGPTAGLTDRSGNGHTLAGAPDSDGQAWCPMKSQFGCNGYLISWAGTWLISATSATLGTLTEATLEYVFARYGVGSLDDTLNGYVSIAGPGESAADNVVFSTYGTSTRNQIGVMIEYGNGTNSYGTFPVYEVMGLTGHMQYFAVTRESDGVTYKLYVDGIYRGTRTLTQPTGGTNVAMVIASIIGDTANSGGCGVFQSVRWSHARYTADQIAEAYQQLRMAA